MRNGLSFWRRIFSLPTRLLPFFLVPAVLFLLPIRFFDHFVWRALGVLSALYVLTTLLYRLPTLYKSGRALLSRRHTGKEKRAWRARAALLGGLLLNLSYALFRIFAGLYTRSPWFWAEAIFYVVLSAVRYILLEEDKRTATLTSKQKERIIAQSYRRCGYFLLLQSAAVCGIVIIAVRERRVVAYPDLVVYGALLFSIWRAGSALPQIRHFGRREHPILFASKALSLASALLSFFALQCTLTARFGASWPHRGFWNGFTGAFTCIFLTVTALIMLYKGKKATDGKT